MSPAPKQRCVVAFFGIDRRLDLTVDSISRHVVEPARDHFDVDLVGHLWSISSIANNRTSESGTLPAPRVALLPDGEYRIDPPVDVRSLAEFERIRAYGDFWRDDFKSLSNLYSQLVSLQRVTHMALARRPHCVVFARPDLVYHDGLNDPLAEAAEAKGDFTFVPHWQPHGGANDRFAICVGDRAIRAYGQRIELAEKFCQLTSQPLHSEKLVRFALDTNRIPVRYTSARASRIRIDGRTTDEDFSLHGWKPWLRVRLGRIKRAALCR